MRRAMRLWDQMLSPAWAMVVVVLGSLGVLAAALAFEYIGGYRPCILCYYQRAPYAANAIIAGCAALAMTYAGGMSWHKIFPVAMIVMALIFLAGAGIAFYHVGVEFHWWPGPDVCQIIGQNTDSIDDLFAEIMKTPIVHCDEVQWSLLGISMAGYNVFLSLGMAGFCALAARRGTAHGW